MNERQLPAIRCILTFSLLGIIACDLSHVLLGTSSQGITSTLSVPLGLYKQRCYVQNLKAGPYTNKQNPPLLPQPQRLPQCVAACLRATNGTVSSTGRQFLP